MSGDENPWSEWLGDGVFAHPDAPCRGGGFFGHAGPAHPRAGVIDPHSPAGRYTSPDEAAAGYASYELERVLSKLHGARSPEDLHWVAADAFGPGSFSGRFCDALRNTAEGRSLLSVQKTMVAAELHDRLNGSGWGLGSRNWSDHFPPRLW
ncbi:MAG: hypothetical protein QM790_17565 [Nibricoccus sp.]